MFLSCVIQLNVGPDKWSVFKSYQQFKLFHEEVTRRYTQVQCKKKTKKRSLQFYLIELNLINAAVCTHIPSFQVVWCQEQNVCGTEKKPTSGMALGSVLS